MGQRQILLQITNLLNRQNIHYLLTGSFAVAYYGFPRATHDIDFILQVQKPNALTLYQALKKIRKTYTFQQSQIQKASKPTQINLTHLETGTKIDFWIAMEKEFKQKYLRKHILELDSTSISLISPEDLILNKLLWCKKIKSQRHINDCVGILKIQKGKLNMKYLHKQSRNLKALKLLKKIIKLSQ